MSVKEASEFHEHLERCKQCETQPFNLCWVGQRLLQDAVRSAGKDVLILDSATAAYRLLQEGATPEPPSTDTLRVTEPAQMRRMTKRWGSPTDPFAAERASRAVPHQGRRERERRLRQLGQR